VSVDGVMRTLQQRGYIAEIGRDSGPGQAVMYGTTSAFLEKVGVDSLADLPALGGFVPGADVVEQLERGLRPDAPSFTERLNALEGSNSDRDHATKAPNGNGGEPVDLDAELGVELDDAPGLPPGSDPDPG
jgi:segregation and condensation protein B